MLVGYIVSVAAIGIALQDLALLFVVALVLVGLVVHRLLRGRLAPAAGPAEA
jgi:hypothetical protein